MDDNTTSTGSPAPEQPQSAPPAASPAMTATPGPTGGGMVSQEDKSQAMLVWVLTIFFGFVPGLIFYLTAKEKPFVYRTAAQALAFEIGVAIAYVGAFILSFLLIGFILFPIIYIAHFAISIMGAVAVNKGEDYTPPLTGGLAKSMFHV